MNHLKIKVALAGGIGGLMVAGISCWNSSVEEITPTVVKCVSIGLFAGIFLGVVLEALKIKEKNNTDATISDKDSDNPVEVSWAEELKSDSQTEEQKPVVAPEVKSLEPQGFDNLTRELMLPTDHSVTEPGIDEDVPVHVPEPATSQLKENDVPKEEGATVPDSKKTPIIELCDYDPTSELPDFRLPGFELLRDYQNLYVSSDIEDVECNKSKIRETLLAFGIEIWSINAMVGPTFTLFEIGLESGKKLSRVKSLSEDIAMSLAATFGIRIIAPIPGRSTIGIELPNRDPQTVPIRSCIENKAFQESKMELPVALGKTITNEVFVFDLVKMPHLLISGATGQGKSVCLNTIITSLLYKKHPAELKLVLIDSKQVELSLYSRIENHYLAKLPYEDDPVITDGWKIINTLNSLIFEMEDRFQLMKDAGVRNIQEYNAKYVRHELNPAKHFVTPLGSKDGTNHKYLPYIVVVIDEYGDLITGYGRNFELPMVCLAQKSRAAGIHLIVTTQRPSVNIITGTIKANFPSRIAFRVASHIDSSIILDQTGAQNLIGRGDLLFSSGNIFERVQ